MTLTSKSNLKTTHTPSTCSVEKNLEAVILFENRDEWNAMRSEDCTNIFTANATDNFFFRMRCNTHKKHNKSEPGLFMEEFRCTEMFYLCSKTYFCYDWESNKYKFSSKGLNKRTLEDCGDGTMSKYRKVLDESVNVTSTNRRFRAVRHGVASFEQTRKRLSNIYPKRIVEDYGLYTKPLHL